MHLLVFVYGTLLRGELNHHLLAAGELVGAHRTESAYTLFQLGGYPGVVRGGSTSIAGEVYRVDQCTLGLLDRLEAYPRLYDRIAIQTPYGRAWAYVYRGSVAGRPVIQSGDWRDHVRSDRLRRGACRYRYDNRRPSGSAR